MEFVNIPHEKLNINNPDYDMEFFWYGFKNLIKNYYQNVEDEGYVFSKEINNFSESLNVLQKEKKYSEIYNNVYVFLKKFLKAVFKTLVNYSNGVICYLFTWLKRYNKIKEAIKLELLNQYNKKAFLENISEDEIILIKIKIFKFIVEKKYDIDLVILFDTNKYLFIKRCIDDECFGIFDYISTRYNLDEYYQKMNLIIKGPIKLIKILKLIY